MLRRHIAIAYGTFDIFWWIPHLGPYKWNEFEQATSMSPSNDKRK